ncbi:MAG TPA: transposase [Candidatus Tectomicrobia bacterium]
MLSLPIAFSSAIGVFAPVFSRPVWQHVKVLMTGAVLAPGQRTVTAILRIMGRSAAPDFQTYHRVLNRAVWSPLTASRLLLRLLVAVFIPRGVVVFGLDDTIERRRGEQITAKGIYRDPVRSSHAHFVKVSGLRWLACMVLTPLSWADRVWALPFLTVLCPSERFYAQRGRRHQTMTERAWQMIQLVVRWLPGREVAFVADSSFAALELLDKVATLPRASVITRLRLDAALYDPPPPRKPRTIGRPRLKGKRRPTLEAVLADERTHWTTLIVDQWYGEGPREVEVTTATAVWYHTGKPPVAVRWVLIRDPKKVFKPQALLSTNLEHTPEQILSWFVRRWTMEVTFEEARAHLGMETQRQWNARAIARTTPALLGLYSIVTLTAHLLIEKGITPVRRMAWYRKTRPTFSDALALVRRQLWDHLHFSMSHQEADMIHIPRALFERFIDAVCYSA